jgi:Skp family chaperone for outer membrane proteins
MNVRIPIAAAALSCAASTAFAQTAGGTGAATLAAQPLGGPLVAGVCLLSREAIYANAAVGKSVTARLQELARAAQAEIDAERAPLEAEAKALEGKSETPQGAPRRQALVSKWRALQLKAAHNGREIEATRGKALSRIATAAQPVIAQVYGHKKCGLLLDRGSALGGNFSNDLTADVVKGLDATVQTIPVELERLPQQAADAQ